MPGDVKPVWSAGQRLLDSFAKYDFGPDVVYTYIPKIRWWQFWHWRVTLSESYVLSRAGELVLIQRMAAELRREVDREIKATLSSPQSA